MVRATPIDWPGLIQKCRSIFIRYSHWSLTGRFGIKHPPKEKLTMSEAETSAAPVLLKESVIPEASIAGWKSADLRKANPLLWQRFS